MSASDALALKPGPVRLGDAERAKERAPIADDMAMLRAAVELTRDISAARASVYWPDMLASALLGDDKQLACWSHGKPLHELVPSEPWVTQRLRG